MTDVDDAELDSPLAGFVDPWELAPEQLNARIDETGVEGEVFRQILRNKLKELPNAKLTIDGLLEMEGLPQLQLALLALNENELRSALGLLLHSWYKTTFEPDAFEIWTQGGPQDATAD